MTNESNTLKIGNIVEYYGETYIVSSIYGSWICIIGINEEQNTHTVVIGSLKFIAKCASDYYFDDENFAVKFPNIFNRINTPGTVDILSNNKTEGRRSK